MNITSDKGWELIKEPTEKPVSNQGKNEHQTYMEREVSTVAMLQLCNPHTAVDV